MKMEIKKLTEVLIELLIEIKKINQKKEKEEVCTKPSKRTKEEIKDTIIGMRHVM